MYERMLEGIICLFIPFYDEVKSLCLLFLILTRARVSLSSPIARVKSNVIEQGAEPIYLHLVRPIIKPYTRTLDATLQLLLMVGDFLFALSTYPLHLALQWWHKRFGLFHESLQTGQDTQGGSSEVYTSDVPTSFLGSSSGPLGDLDVEQPETATIQLPRKVTSKTPQRQLSNGARSHNSGPRNLNTLHTQNSESGSSTNPKMETRGQRTLPSSQNGSKVVTANSSSAVNPANNATRHRREGEASSSRHQIWHPPRSYTDDEEDQVDLTLRPSDFQGSQEETSIAHKQKELDEWRQYPPFPSAYPPTPLVVTSRLAETSIVRSSIYPAIEEERSQQDFHQSLLPPREPLNPSPAGDSSDQSFTFGISPYQLARQGTTTDEADDSMSTDDYEDEDEFNMTLRTPLQPLGSIRSQLLPRRRVSLASGSSAVPSRLSTLTTADNGSSLRTCTSSETLSATESIPVPVIGKKRSYPRIKSNNIKNLVSQFEGRGPDEIAEPDPLATVPIGTTRDRPNAMVNSDASDTVDDDDDDPESSLKSSDEGVYKAPEEKRRKVLRSSARVAASRSNIKRHNPPPPSQTRKSKVTTTEPVATKRFSSRIKSGSRAHAVEASLNTLSSESASTSDLTPPPVPPKTNTRQMRSIR